MGEHPHPLVRNGTPKTCACTTGYDMAGVRRFSHHPPGGVRMICSGARHHPKVKNLRPLDWDCQTGIKYVVLV